MHEGAGSSPSPTNEPCSDPSPRARSESKKDNPTSKSSPAVRFTFGPDRRIQKSKEFRQVYDSGRKIAKASFVAFCLNRGDDNPTRIGITTPRALGKANRRNRIRRRIREAVRLNLWRLPHGWSLVFNPRRLAGNGPFAEIAREVEQVLNKCAAS